MSENRYSKDGPFNDPVLRCDSCSKLVRHVVLTQMGKCPHCGSRKVRKMDTFNSEELKQMQEWGIDQDYLALFEVVPEIGGEA